MKKYIKHLFSIIKISGHCNNLSDNNNTNPPPANTKLPYSNNNNNSNNLHLPNMCRIVMDLLWRS